MIKKLVNHIRKLRFAKIQRRKLNKKGTLLNASKKKKVIFIHIPKTAGVSLVKAIYGDVSLEGHRPVWFYKKVFARKYPDYFTFSFVRNPWDRLYSAYKFLEKGGANIHDKKAFDMYLSEYKSFEDFVMTGLSKQIMLEITHFIPQSEFICDNNNSILVHFVGRFETLNNSILDLEKLINTKIKLEHYNINEKKNYTEVYTEEMILKVKETYKRDIDIFGYNF